MKPEQLRLKNPHLEIFDIYDKRFEAYGHVIDIGGMEQLHLAMQKIPIPEEGNCYKAADESLMSLDIIEEIKRSVFGDMPIEAGYCNGHSYTLNALEYHRCSEVNFTTSGLVLLLGRPEDICERRIDSSRLSAVYLPPDVLIEIYPRVLHFAPCRIEEDGFNCLVVLADGTNSPLDKTDSTLAGEDGMLWMRNKWLLCHPDSPQAEKGAFVGITGENIKLNI